MERVEKTREEKGWEWKGGQWTIGNTIDLLKVWYIGVEKKKHHKLWKKSTEGIEEGWEH